MRETNFIRQNKEKWAEFEHSLQQKQTDPDRLNDLYVQITDDLSYSRTFYPNRSVRVYLNGLAQRIFFKIYRSRRSHANRLLTFWTDELPQLINVLRGDMSLVGPRPHAVAHDEYYATLIDGYLGRHRAKPGITGWAQVNGCRGEIHTIEDMRRRIELDLFYIDNWSLWFDFRILARTAMICFRDEQAY